MSKKKNNKPRNSSNQSNNNNNQNRNTDNQNNSNQSNAQKSNNPNNNNNPKADSVKPAETKAAETKAADIKKPEVKAAERPKQAQDKGRKAVRMTNTTIEGLKSIDFKSRDIKVLAVSALKILLPLAACIIVIAVIVSFISSRKNSDVEEVAFNSGDAAQSVMSLPQEPLAVDAYPEVNALMSEFYQALADGDMNTVTRLLDETRDEDLIIFEKRSEFIESYDNLTCYTKNGIDGNSYFVYVSFEVKFKDIDTKPPGLNSFYVYRNDDGNLVIDGQLDESTRATLDLVTVQQDVIDLFNKIDVVYTEALASDEQLSAFMSELPTQVKSSVGVALAQLETPNEEQTEGSSQQDGAGEQQEGQSEEQQEEILQNQTVNQIVRATDTVNVRSSDSEEADRIGRVTTGTELTRVEERINGWSKVIYEGKEAFIKSDYLEVVSTQAVDEVIRQVTAKTNVNVRSAPSQDSTKLGLAESKQKYDLLEDLGEWYKINFNGNNGYVKAEYFE